jgi:hypothetical protein
VYQISSPDYILACLIEFQAWFLGDISQIDPRQFQRFFRVSTSIFSYICDLLIEDLKTHPPAGLRVLSNRLLMVERQVAIALQCFVGRDLLLSIEVMFGYQNQQLLSQYEGL